jgi:phosphate-selective porin OprO/OprP
MRKQLLLLALLGSGTHQSHAEATGLLTGKTYTGETTYDKIWSLPVLFKDESNPILQEFALQGRGQLQWAEVNESGNHYNGNDFNNGATGQERFLGNSAEVRRLRLGIKSKWFNQYKLEGQFDLDPDFSYHTGDPDIIPGFAKQLYDLYVTYAPSDAFNLSIGKTKAKFSREQEISSKEILTIERSNLSNVLTAGELTGIWASGKGIAEHWLYEAGIYSNERSSGFTSLSGDNGEIFLAKVGYDYSAAAGLDTAVAGLHLMYNSDPGTKTGNFGATPKYSTSISLNNDITSGRFGLTTEMLWANGDVGQSDVFGVSIIPSFFVADGLQLVGRLQYANSDRANGLSLPGRYEAVIPGDDKGDEYLSGYLGLNYYLYGHKLKLMAGVEYSALDGNGPSGDYDGYTAFSGLRFFF